MALSGLPVPSFFSQTVRLSFSKGRTGRSRKYLIYNDENQTASQSGRNAPERKFLLPLCGCPFRMSPGQFHETFTVFYAKVLSLFQVCTVATDLEHPQQTSVLFKDGDVPFLSDFSGKCVERSRRKF